MDDKTPGQMLKELPTGKFLKVDKIHPAGSLEARRLASGVTFYWRVTLGGKTDRTCIGTYDAGAPPKSTVPTARGYSVAAAKRAAEGLAQAHVDHLDVGGYQGMLAAEAEAKRAAAAAKSEAQRAAEAADARRVAEELARARYSLANLMTDYCDHLEALGRRSHKDVRSITKLHIVEQWPEVAAKPAGDVTMEEVADMMRRALELGKGRTANKLRSYVRAAYQTAKAARSKASIPVHFKNYNIVFNPAADTAPDETANKTDKNPLTAEELRTYWQTVKTLPGFRGAVLRLHLLLGGQRIEQLVNLKTADVTAESITLYDGKGRPGKPPRPHTVPLTKQAAEALRECNPQGAYALSTDTGVTHVAATTLADWAVKVCTLPDFQAKRIRSGVETLLAANRVSMEIRGRLQSHGISGVQARHYDGHDYLPEKLQALTLLFRELDSPTTGNVIQFKAA